MKQLLAKMTVMTAFAWALLPAAAQTAAKAVEADRAAAKATAPVMVSQKQIGATAQARPAAATLTTTVQAAGSVIVLADGIVANAQMALIQAPAPGFVYER